MPRVWPFMKGPCALVKMCILPLLNTIFYRFQLGHFTYSALTDFLPIFVLVTERRNVEAFSFDEQFLLSFLPISDSSILMLWC